jgi:mRNA-degrading endonuclease toxin of MazEF toxin-antitoxin module
MGKYKQGDVLFLNFPFSDDLTKSKARPNLPIKSVVRTHLVHSINTSVIRNEWGEISEEKLIRVLENLQIILEKQ